MNKSDLSRNLFMLQGKLANQGYDWWWHSFTGYNEKTGKPKAFFIEYFIINPGLGKDRPIFGQVKYNNECLKPSYVMIKAGAWGENAKQLHEFYPISSLKINANALNLSVGKCMLNENHMYGKVYVSEDKLQKHPEYMCDAGEMEWDLRINKKVSFNVGYGASKFFRRLNAFEMFWHAEGMKTEYEGTIKYDGVAYNVVPKKSYGYADKNWGKDFTSPWVWISSCNMKSEITGRVLNNSVFDIGGGTPKVFGIPINRKLLIDLFYEGKDYEFNFSKFWNGVKTKFECSETEDTVIWKVATQNRKNLLELSCTCSKKDMILVNYESPDGAKRHNRLWNGGTGKGEFSLYKKEKGKKVLIDKVIFTNAGCEYGEY